MQANISDLLAESATLLLVGMSVVFIFLTMLIGAIQLIARLNTLFPSKEIQPSNTFSARSNIKSAAPDDVSPDTIAAITAAIHQFRKTR